MKRKIVQGRPLPKMAGVTLIELMVVVMIVAILTAIAVPAYQSHAAKTYRRAAESCLSEFAQNMERYYTSNLTYVGAAPAPGCQADVSLATRYTFATDNLAQQTYTVKATPTAVQLARDGNCGTLSVNETGTRGATGSAGVAGCW